MAACQQQTQIMWPTFWLAAQGLPSRTSWVAMLVVAVAFLTPAQPWGHMAFLQVQLLFCTQDAKHLSAWATCADAVLVPVAAHWHV